LSATCSAAGNSCEILCDRLVLLKVLVLLKITQKKLAILLVSSFCLTLRQ
jgi:hypothetical protein